VPDDTPDDLSIVGHIYRRYMGKSWMEMSDGRWAWI